MAEPKIELPAWLPWATTACLAAIVACLVELWMIEKSRNQLLKDEGQLAESAMQGVENQLEAERIISRREIESLRRAPGAEAALRVSLLAPPAPGAPRNGPAPQGALAWDPADGRGVIRFSGLSGQAPGRDYQLWLEGAGMRLPASCAVFHPDAGDAVAEIHLDPAAGTAGRFLLIDVVKGGCRTLEEARAGGSIVLATPLPAGRISN